MNKLFFTADLHFSHVNILAYTKRPWPDIEAMNDALVCNWNRVVAPEDTVIIIGDLAMGKRVESVPIARLLNGHKVLIPGNHDNCWDQGRDGTKPADVFSRAEHVRNNVAKYIEWGGLAAIWQPPVYNYMTNGRRVTLSHFPPIEAGDHTTELRFEAFRPPAPAEGEWMLCGHVHEAWKVRGRVINVGVDVWDYTPVPATTLIDIIEGRITGAL